MSQNNISLATASNALEQSQPQPQLCRLSDLLSDWERESRAAHDSYTGGTARGPVSGFTALDREMGGCFAAGLHFVHGQPGTGKTALGLQFAATCGTPALFVSCEMAPLELLRRHTARVTKTYLGKLKSGELPPTQSIALVKQAVSASPELALLDATRAPASPQFLRDSALIARGENRHLLVVIDSLQSWVEGVASGASEYEALGEGIARLRQLAHELNAPFFLMCERNRESMKGGGLSAGAGSRKIEYSAETVIDLSLEEEAREDVYGDKPVRLRLTKNRHGAVGKTIDLKFNGGFQRFQIK
jgi:replicative DNA helicase